MDEEDGGRPFVSFQNVVSFGNVLIIVTMLATAGSVLLVVGRELQGVLDDAKQLHSDLLHETEMRVAGEKALTEARIAGESAIVGKITDMTNQESRDVQGINQTLQDMRTDYRELLRTSGPAGPRH